LEERSRESVGTCSRVEDVSSLGQSRGLSGDGGIVGNLSFLNGRNGDKVGSTRRSNGWGNRGSSVQIDRLSRLSRRHGGSEGRGLSVEWYEGSRRRCVVVHRYTGEGSRYELCRLEPSSREEMRRLLRVLENTSIAVSAVGEVSAWDRLGDLCWWEFGSIGVPVMGNRQPLLTTRERCTAIHSTKLTVVSEILSLSRNRHRSEMGSRRHAELVCGRLSRVQYGENRRVRGNGRRRRVCACSHKSRICELNLGGKDKQQLTGHDEFTNNIDLTGIYCLKHRGQTGSRV
jgi:hypothetical protein